MDSIVVVNAIERIMHAECTIFLSHGLVHHPRWFDAVTRLVLRSFAV